MSAAWWVLLAIPLTVVAWIMSRLGFIGRLAWLTTWNGRTATLVQDAATRYGSSRIIFDLDQDLEWTSLRSWTAADVECTTSRLSQALLRHGILRGDRVAIYKSNAFDYYLFGQAAIRIGAIAVPVNGNVEPAVAAAYLSRVAASVLFTDPGHALRLSEQASSIDTLRVVIGAGSAWANTAVMKGAATAKAESMTVYADVTALINKVQNDEPSAAESDVRVAGDDDPVYLVHTSGTTGVPKAVIVSAAGMAQAIRSVAVFNPVSRRDRIMFCLPLNHQVAQLYLSTVLLLGLRCWVQGALDCTRIRNVIQDWRPTVFFAFPITFTRLLRYGTPDRSMDSVRIWGATGDASHEFHQRPFCQVGSFFKDIGIPLRGSLFVDGLGSSEVGIAALLNIVTPWTHQFGRRVGKRAPLGPKLKVLDQAGQEVGHGQPGRLYIKGRSMFRGYWNQHHLFYGTTLDGWWFTGDIVSTTKSGHFVHLDREVDAIHTKDGTVHTLPLEEILLAQPDVLDASVFSLGDKSGAHRVGAIVALKDGVAPVDSDVLLALLRSSHERLAMIDRIWIVDLEEMPFGATGKTLKRQLRLLYAERTSDSETEAMEAEPVERVGVAV